MHPVEIVEVERGDGGEHHNASGVHHHVDPAEFGLDGVERRGHGDLVGHVTTHSDGLATRRADGVNGGVGLGLVAGVVHTHRESIFREAFDHRAADAAGAACDEGDAGGGGGCGVGGVGGGVSHG